jgi:3-dehydroquinate synthase
MPSFQLNIPSSQFSYWVLIQKNLLSQIGSHFKSFPRVFLLSEESVDTLYGQVFRESLKAQGVSYHTHIVPPGEASKSLAVAESLFSAMLDFEMDRDTPLIALGGGMISDLGGYCAGLFLRGIPWFSVSTTLLGQVDASVGGKVAVNFKQTKNILGQFYPPRAVFIDPLVLKTLPPAEQRSGWGEVLKYGVIGDPVLFEKAEGTSWENFLAEPEPWIFACLQQKKEIVCEDEKEQGRRLFLNFGHTIGHALESCQNFQLTHGEAVALGMLVEMEMASKLNILQDPTLEVRLLKILQRFGFATHFTVSSSEFWTYLFRDKKKKAQHLSFVFPVRLGEVKSFPLEQKQVREGIFPSAYLQGT